MSEKIATIKKEDDISIITLNDGKANVFSPEMSNQLNACLDEVDTESGCLIITGREGMFSAGLDLKIIQSGDVDRIVEMSSNAFKLLARIFSFPRPVIAACSGHGIALGTFLICCCDYRIGIDGEFVVQANEVRNNMDIPIPIMEIAASRVDKQHIYRALFHADPYKMSDAVSAGWIDEVVSSPEDLMPRAMEKLSLIHI